jgi:hypothetical protein
MALSYHSSGLKRSQCACIDRCQKKERFFVIFSELKLSAQQKSQSALF